MNYPPPLDPDIKTKGLKTQNYLRAGNSYRFTDSGLIILKSGKRFHIHFSQIGEQTKIATNANKNSDLNHYVLDAEYYRLLQQNISLSHFSTFSDGENAFVLTGPPNTGKTGINLALNIRGFKFMADENAPVTTSGQALPLQMPLSVGNKNIEEFQQLLKDLNVNYSRIKINVFKQARKLEFSLINKALDRLVEPVKIDPSNFRFESDKKDISIAFYIQPEKRNDIYIEEMDRAEFIHKMVLWNQMQRRSFEEAYRIWRTEFVESNDLIEKSEKFDRRVLKNCFENVRIKKLRVPLKRQPHKIAEFIEEKI